MLAGGAAFLATLVAALASGRIGPECLGTISSIVAISIAYPMKLLPGGKAVKSIPGAKLLMIGASFTLVVSLLAQFAAAPAIGVTRNSAQVLQLGVAVGMFVCSCANLSDIEDMEGDRAEGVNTLAVVLGAEAAKAVSVALSMVAAALLMGLDSTPGSHPLTGCGATVASTLWVLMAATWTPKMTPLSYFLKLKHCGWLTFSLPVLLL